MICETSADVFFGKKQKQLQYPASVKSIVIAMLAAVDISTIIDKHQSEGELLGNPELAELFLDSEKQNKLLLDEQNVGSGQWRDGMGE